MPLIYFLKLYARLAGFVLLIAVLCVLLFQGLNGIRQQMWLEQHGTALMQWLAKSADPVGHYAWLVPAYNLEVGPATQLADTAVIRERLGYGQVVVLPSSLGQRLLIAREDGQILALNLATPYSDIVRASALVFRWHLDSSPIERRPETLRYFSGVGTATGDFTYADANDNSAGTGLPLSKASWNDPFDTADDALSTDFAPALADIRAATDRIGGAAQQVSDDLPQITADLRGLIARADRVVAQVQSITSDAAPGIRNFTGTGLNELSRLSGEARTLVQSLEQLVRRIGKDPARFLLDGRVPEYRR